MKCTRILQAFLKTKRRILINYRIAISNYNKTMINLKKKAKYNINNNNNNKRLL